MLIKETFLSTHDLCVKMRYGEPRGGGQPRTRQPKTRRQLAAESHFEIGLQSQLRTETI